MNVPAPAAGDRTPAAYAEAYGITLSSRVRLARNLRGVPFPDQAPPAVRLEHNGSVTVRGRPVDVERDGLPVHDGGASYVLVAFCPWCGARLPESQRDRWFEETEAKGFTDDTLPPEYRTGAWRLRR